MWAVSLNPAPAGLGPLRSTRGGHVVENKYLIVITDFQERECFPWRGCYGARETNLPGSVPLLQHSGKHHFKETKIPEAFQS